MEMFFRKTLILSFFCVSCLFAADLNADLFEAVRRGDSSKVRELLNRGADVNAKGPYDQTPLFFAADRGHTEVVKILLERGAEVNLKDTFYNFTALGRAAMKQRTDVVRLLLESGAEGAGQLLYQGSAQGNKDLVKMILEIGKATPRDLSAALNAASRRKQDELADLLRAAGAVPPPPADHPINPALLAIYAGTYLGGRGGTEFEVQLTVQGDKLRGTFMGQALTFAAVSDTELRSVEQDTVSIEFQTSAGKPTGFLLRQGGTQTPFTRKQEENR